MDIVVLAISVGIRSSLLIKGSLQHHCHLISFISVLQIGKLTYRTLGSNGMPKGILKANLHLYVKINYPIE